LVYREGGRVMSAQTAYAPTLWHEMFATVFNDHQPSTGAQRAALAEKSPIPCQSLHWHSSGQARILYSSRQLGEARADELIE